MNIYNNLCINKGVLVIFMQILCSEPQFDAAFHYIRNPYQKIK